jgi:hypothetical protein
MLSRRAFVLGGGAILAAGLGAGAVLEADDGLRTRVLHKAGIAGSPDAHVPAWGARSRLLPERCANFDALSPSVRDKASKFVG